MTGALDPKYSGGTPFQPTSQPQTSLTEREVIKCQRHLLDHVLVRFRVPLARHKLHRPGPIQRPPPQRRPIPIELHDVQVSLVIGIGEPEPTRRDGDVLEPVEEVPVLGDPALQGDVREREAAWTFVGYQAR